MRALGKKKWVIPAGHIPLKSTGKEPEFLSQDRIAVLNTAENTATIKITVYYTNQEPSGEHKIKIKGQRLKKIRINDLINPLPVFLETEYALVIESDHEVVVQYMQMKTVHGKAALMGTMAYGTDG